MPEKRLTLKMIAEMAGVDKAIVSKVINNVADGHVSNEKRKRIEEIVRIHEYTPSVAAQSLRSKRSNQIAFLLSSATKASFRNEDFAEMLCGVDAACKRLGYQCQVSTCDFMNIDNFLMPANLRRQGVDGCILTGAIFPDVLDKIAALNIPLLVLGGEPLRGRVPLVSRASRPEYEIFLRRCLEKNHLSIWLAGTIGRQKETYLEMAAKISPEMRLVFPGTGVEGDFEAGARAAEFFLTTPSRLRPTLVAGNGLFVCSFSCLLAKHGLTCPRDVSLVSFSDTDMARCHHPPLTTYSMNFFEMGEKGADALVQILEKRLDAQGAIELTNAVTIKSRWTERDSTRTLGIGSGDKAWEGRGKNSGKDNQTEGGLA